MKKVSDIQALLQKQAGKEAAVILNKDEKMLRQGAPRTKIEKMLAADLCAHVKKQTKHVIVLVDC